MTTAYVTLTIGQAAELLPVPGSTRAARAQKLRRLEQSGAIPKPPRNLFGDREYTLEHLREVEAILRSATAEESGEGGFTLAEVATITGIPRSTIRDAEQAGEIPPVPRIGGRRRYSPQMLQLIRALPWRQTA